MPLLVRDTGCSANIVANIPAPNPAEISLQNRSSMLFQEIANGKHQRNHLLIHGRPHLPLSLVGILQRVAQYEVCQFMGQPKSSYVPSSDGQEILKFSLIWPGSWIELEVERTQATLHPVTDERGPACCNEVVQRMTSPPESKEIGDGQVAQNVYVELVGQPKKCSKESTGARSVGARVGG